MNYTLKISPLFKRDLAEISDYITNSLNNQQAARNLVAEMCNAIQKRIEMPLAAEAFHSRRTDEVFYRIYVKNYVVYYIVDGDSVKLMRILHGSRDVNRLL